VLGQPCLRAQSSGSCPTLFVHPVDARKESMPNRVMININTSSVRGNVSLWVCMHLPPSLAPAVTHHPCSPAPDVFRWRSTMRQVFAPSTAEQSPTIRCNTKETAVPRRMIVPRLSLLSLRTARVSAAATTPISMHPTLLVSLQFATADVAQPAFTGRTRYTPRARPFSTCFRCVRPFFYETLAF